MLTLSLLVTAAPVAPASTPRIAVKNPASVPKITVVNNCGPNTTVIFDGPPGNCGQSGENCGKIAEQALSKGWEAGFYLAPTPYDAKTNNNMGAATLVQLWPCSALGENCTENGTGNWGVGGHQDNVFARALTTDATGPVAAQTDAKRCSRDSVAERNATVYTSSVF